MTREAKYALHTLAGNFFHSDHAEPFWEDEYEAEPGFAFENQVRNLAPRCPTAVTTRSS